MTRRAALIGHPLNRRHSEVMHNAAFKHFSIDARYELHDLAPDEVGSFIALARDESCIGFQVTAPYKQIVIEHLDEIESGAKRIGAVNSVLRGEDGSLVGFNTDAPGFRRAAESELDIRFSGLRAAVVGAGGASRAVIHALVAADAEQVTICNRTASRAADLANHFGPTVRAVEVGTAFERSLHQADLAVNATTVGMITPGAAFDPAVLPGSAVVYDLVYNPPETKLLRESRALGLAAANGLGMLVAQAEIAFERWTGVPDAGPVMLAALRDGPDPLVPG